MGNYLYAAGRVSACESRLLSIETLRKAASSSRREYVKNLIALGYGDNEDTVEGLVESELAKTRAFLIEIAPNEIEVRSFFLSSLARTIKTLFKTKLYLGGVLRIDTPKEAHAWRDAIMEQNDEGLSKEEKVLFKSIETLLSSTLSPREVDAKIDDAIFTWAKSQTSSIGIRNWLAHKIDLVNLSSLKRARDLGWDRVTVGKVFLHGGTIAPEELIRYPDERAVARAAALILGGKAADAYLKYPKAGEFERAIEKLSLEEAISLRIESASAGPMLAYYLEKNAEAENVRMLAIDPKAEKSELMEY